MGQMTFRASFEKHKRPEVNELGNTLNWPVGQFKTLFSTFTVYEDIVRYSITLDNQIIFIIPRIRLINVCNINFIYDMTRATSTKRKHRHQSHQQTEQTGGTH